MPARTNPFQQVVKYIYDQISDGAKVTESAFLVDATGERREVDILIERSFADVDLLIAVECRKHGRRQNVEWIDLLIGKYKHLRVNKLIAISPTPFSASAKSKAEVEGIEAITVNEALTKDWKASIEQWKFYANSHTVIEIATFLYDGNILTLTRASDDGKEIWHRDPFSAYLYQRLLDHLTNSCGEAVQQAIAERIKPKWQEYFSAKVPIYDEVTIVHPEMGHEMRALGILCISYRIATLFHAGGPTDHFALHKHSLSNVGVQMVQRTHVIRTIFDEKAHPVSVDFGNGRVVHGPFADGEHKYRFPKKDEDQRSD